MLSKVTIGTKLQTRLNQQGFNVKVRDGLLRSLSHSYLSNLYPLANSNLGKKLEARIIQQAKFKIMGIYWDASARELIAENLKDKDLDSPNLLERIGKLAKVNIIYDGEAKRIILTTNESLLHTGETDEMVLLEEDPDHPCSPISDISHLERFLREQPLQVSQREYVNCLTPEEEAKLARNREKLIRLGVLPFPDKPEEPKD